jgi:cytidylate kinase
LADAVFSPPEELRSYLEPFERRADYAATVPRSVAAPPAEEIRRLIDDAIVEIADRGSVVILAHAASVTLRNRPDVLRVHVVASIATRIHRLWVPNKLIAEREYARQIEESDHQRRKYLERFHGIDAEPPTLYDLVINTDSLDVDRAAAAIVAAVTT